MSSNCYFIFLFLITSSLITSCPRSLGREFPYPPFSFSLTSTNAFDCFNALSEIRSCSNEIASYFTNGTTNISPACCKSITLITRQCWSAMLSALGLSPDQTYILRGYCDANSVSDHVVGFGPVPSPLPAVKKVELEN